MVQIFLQQVVQNETIFNRHEVEDALNLKDCPQTMKPTMLGADDGFIELSSTDLIIFHRYCQRRLLPKAFNETSEDSEDAK